MYLVSSLLANTTAKFNATVTSTSADLSFSFIDTETNWQVEGSFKGTHWDKSPKVLFDKDTIVTEGQLEHVQPRAPKDTRSWFEKYMKYIFIGVGIVLLIGIVWFLWKCAGVMINCVKCCFPCCSRERRDARANKKNMAQYQTSFPSSTDQTQVYSTPQMVYANKTNNATETVTSILPYDPRDSECNYAVSPKVMQSYFARDGKYLVEMANAQMDLHQAHRDQQAASRRGEEDKVGFARAMIGHHSAVIEHYMALRAAGM
jgi:hypothetical protein